METAFEYNTEIEVHAENASPLKRYRCKCGREVCLINRGLVRPHFKHLYDSKAFDCERYQSGYYGPGGWNVFNEKRKIIKLYAHVEITENAQSWGLDLYVSREVFQEYVGHEVGISDAYPRPMRLPIVNHMNDLSIKVFPNDKEYRVLIGEDTVVVPGLNRETITVFQCTEGMGRQLDNSQTLVVGETYLLVSKHNLSLHLTGCSFCTLSSYQGWNAGILTIPINPDNTMRTWCRDVLNRSISLPGLSMRVLSPIDSERNVDGSFRVPPDTPILIGVYGPHGQYVSPLLGIKKLTEEIMPKWIDLCGELPLVFRVSELSPGEYGFILKGEQECFLFLKVEDTTRAFEPPGISLIIEDNNGKLSRNIPLISEELPEQFDLIRKKKAVLKSCHIPYEATLRLEIGIGSSKGVEKHLRNYKNQINEMYEDELLYTQASSILIDGGNFGCVYLRYDTKSSKKILPHLDPSLRSRISWLVQTVRNKRNPKQLVYTGTEQKCLSNLFLDDKDDHKLVQEFLRIEFWPNSLYHQVLSVLKAINIS